MQLLRPSPCEFLRKKLAMPLLLSWLRRPHFFAVFCLPPLLWANNLLHTSQSTSACTALPTSHLCTHSATFFYLCCDIHHCQCANWPFSQVLSCQGKNSSLHYFYFVMYIDSVWINSPARTIRKILKQLQEARKKCLSEKCTELRVTRETLLHAQCSCISAVACAYTEI